MIIQMSYASIGENPGCETSQPGIFLRCNFVEALGRF